MVIFNHSNPYKYHFLLEFYFIVFLQQVTIVDRDERDEQNLITRRAVGMRELVVDENRLNFHPNCGSHAAVINGGLTAHRPNAADDFNFGVVLTSRHLKPNEIFEVRLDKMVSKWAGSIEIGNFTVFVFKCLLSSSLLKS